MFDRASSSASLKGKIMEIANIYRSLRGSSEALFRRQ